MQLVTEDELLSVFNTDLYRLYDVRSIRMIFSKFYPILKRDPAEAGYPTLHNRHKPRGVELDHISIAEWLGTAF